MTQGSEPSRKERILAATCAVIARRGIEAFEVKDVAEVADVTPQLLYYHFRNRRDLIRAALEYAAEQAPSVNLLRHDSDLTGFEAVRNALLAEFDDEPRVRNLNLIWNEVAAIATQNPEFHADVAQVTSRWGEQVTIGVLRGIADGSIESELGPGDLAQVITCAVEGLSQRWLAGLISQDEARQNLGLLLNAFSAAPVDN